MKTPINIPFHIVIIPHFQCFFFLNISTFALFSLFHLIIISLLLLLIFERDFIHKVPYNSLCRACWWLNNRGRLQLFLGGTRWKRFESTRVLSRRSQKRLEFMCGLVLYYVLRGRVSIYTVYIVFNVFGCWSLWFVIRILIFLTVDHRVRLLFHRNGFFELFVHHYRFLIHVQLWLERCSLHHLTLDLFFSILSLLLFLLRPQLLPLVQRQILPFLQQHIRLMRGFTLTNN